MGAFSNHVLLHEPRWKEALLGRHRRMVERDKNHPCIIIWSLGNESGNGPHFMSAYEWIKERDPSRPVQFESAFRAPTRIFIVRCTRFPPIWKATPKDPARTVPSSCVSMPTRWVTVSETFRTIGTLSKRMTYCRAAVSGNGAILPYSNLYRTVRDATSRMEATLETFRTTATFVAMALCNRIEAKPLSA